MGKVILFLKFLVNIFLYCFYLLVSMFIGGWLYGYYKTNILKESLPIHGDIIYYKLGISIGILVLIFTLLFRNFFYLSLFKKKKGS